MRLIGIRTFRTQDDSYQDVSYPRRFVPKTFRTQTAKIQNTIQTAVINMVVETKRLGYETSSNRLIQCAPADIIKTFFSLFTYHVKVCS